MSLPATAWAEGAQVNGRPFPATAWAEGGQFNGPRSPRGGAYTVSACVRPASLWPLYL